MKQILGKVCRASVAAAGVVVAASAANAESRPLELETEFDLGHVGGVSLDASAAVKAAALDVSSAVGNWQESIGTYLDGLLADRTPGVEAAKTEAKAQATVDANEVIEEEIAAFKPAEPAKAEPKVEEATAEPANALLLAPVLSHPMDCAECQKLVQQAAARDAEDAQSRVDDAAAWQNLADWAGSRLADDAAAATAAADDDDVATAESAFFDDVGDPTLAD